jgi:thymidylate kinase
MDAYALGGEQAMAAKIIIMGRPGSGKSFASRCIRDYLQQKNYGWSIARFNDYEILKDMFRFEMLFPAYNQPRKFRPVAYGGFDVCDFSVLDTSLRELEKQVQRAYSPYKEELISIEFARPDYNIAFSLFNRKFLKNTYLLFLNADVDTCLARIHDRVTHPTSQDDYFVSESILRTYYNKQVTPDLSKWNIPSNRMITINSKGSVNSFRKKIEYLTETIIEDEMRAWDIDIPDHSLIDKLSKVSGFLHMRRYLPGYENSRVLKSRSMIQR